MYAGDVRVKILNNCLEGETLDKVSISSNGMKCPAAKMNVAGTILK